MRARLLGLAAAGLALLSAPARAGVPDPDDTIFLEVRLKGLVLGEGVRGYRQGKGACLILPDMLQVLDLPIEVNAEAGTAKGWAFQESRTVDIDRKAGRVTVAGVGQSGGATAVTDTPEGWCVDAQALSQWLGVKLEPNLSGAALLVRSEVKLPVELAAERRQRATAAAARTRPVALAGLPAVKLPYLLFRPPALDAVVTVNGVRDKLRGTRVDRRYELFGAGEFLTMSTDARLASDNRGRPSSLRVRMFRTDPDARLLGPLGATHVGAGDVSGFTSSLVSGGTAGRGFVVTNRPVERPEAFDRVQFEGDLPAGWDAELYRNDQLLAFAGDRSDGRYQFRDVALLFGANRFAVVLYGPQGQVRRREELVNVGLDSIPKGKTYYWAGASQDERDLLSLSRPPPGVERRGWRGALGLEHGLDARTSLALSVQTLVLGDERLTYVEGAVRRAVGPALVELSGAWSRTGGHAARAQMLGELGGVYVSAESVMARGGFVSDRVEPGVTGRHTLALDGNVRAGRMSLPLHAEARMFQRADGAARLEAAARLGVAYNNFSLTGGLDWQRQNSRGPDPPDRMLLSALGNLRLRGVQLRGEARWRLGDRAGLENATLVGELGSADRSLWRAELGWDGPLERGRAGLGWSRRFSQFALGVSAEAATDGSLAGGLNLSFGLGGGGGFLRPSAERLAASGQVLARVYRDSNNDGVRQASERFERGVGITAGMAVADGTTDATGVAFVGKLTPYRPVSIGIDASTLPDPMVAPRMIGQVVTPRPGVTAIVEIPLVGAGEVEGRLVRDGGAALEGVVLELTGSNGRTVASATSDFDGFFLFEKVPYGRYGLRVATLSAGAEELDPSLEARAEVSEAKPIGQMGTVVARKSSGTTS